jgi:hypothetical protein
VIDGVMAKRVAKFGLVLLAAVMLAGVGCAKKQKADTRKWEVQVKVESGPVEVRVRVDKKTITLADKFNMQLEAAAEEGYEVTMPRLDNLPEYLALKDWREQSRRMDDKGRTVRTVECELEPLVSGEYEIPAMEFTFLKTTAADPNDSAKVYTATTEPVELKVTSLSESDPNWKPEIADIEPVMDMPRQYGRLWMWLGGVAAAALLGLAAWLLLGGRRDKEPGAIMIPAHELAYQRLRELISEDLVGRGRIKEFYERISNILRHYIEDRFNMRAPERTTEEFLFELGGSSVLDAGDKESLGKFMTHCDLVKFAKHQPEPGDIQKTFDLVKEFIEKTRSDIKVVEQGAAVTKEEA